jgi:hypothetical protein
VTTLGITTKSATISIYDADYNDTESQALFSEAVKPTVLSIVMLNVVMQTVVLRVLIR